MAAVHDKWLSVTEHLWLKRMLGAFIPAPLQPARRALLLDRSIHNLGKAGAEYSLAVIRADALADGPTQSCTLDCSYVAFCAGPCSSRLTETAPGAEFPRVFLLPREPDQSFPTMRYALKSGIEITLNNARVCSRCFREFCVLRDARAL